MQRHVDIAETLIRRAGKRLGEAYAAFWEASSPKIEDFKTTQLLQKESESCIEAILLFQAGMEAIINEEINTNKKLIGVRKEREYHQKRVRDLSFKNKWENSYKALKVTDTEKYLERYLDFYRDFRVPITHPNNRYLDVAAYRFPEVYKGIRNGWMAFMTLASGWEHDAKEQSWARFCEEANLPEEIAEDNGN